MYLGYDGSEDGNIVYRSSKLLVYCTVLFMYLGDEDSGDGNIVYRSSKLLREEGTFSFNS